MKPIRIKSGMLLGSILLMAGCTERNTPTALRNSRPAFDASPALASSITDPVGDVKNKVPAWLDIVSASITLRGRLFTFEAELAAPVPADPALDPDVPPQTDHVALAAYALDTDPTTAPVGYPFNKNEAVIFEFFLGVLWNPTGSFGVGTGFIGLVADRRPLLTGGQATITAIPFTIQGTHVSAVVDAAALGNPATFAWGAFTEMAQHPHPPDNFCCSDSAPDAGLAAWPQ